MKAGARPAVFLLVEVDGKVVLRFHPAVDQCFGIICRAVIHDQPLKFMAGLTNQQLIQLAQDIGPVVGGGKDGLFHVTSPSHGLHLLLFQHIFRQ